MPVASVQKQEVTADILKFVTELQQSGALKKWGAALADLPDRRTTMLGEFPCAHAPMRRTAMGHAGDNIMSFAAFPPCKLTLS